MKIGNLLQKLKSIFATIFFVLAIYFLVYTLLPVSAKIKCLGYATLTVKTNSMKGVLSAGDVIIIKKADLETLKAGDIITFYADYEGDGEKEVFTHFIAQIERDETGFHIRTKSNITDRWDNWILTEKDVIGKVDNSFHGIFYYLSAHNFSINTGALITTLLLFASGFLLISTKNDRSNFLS